MTVVDLDQLITHIDARMARAEGHLAGVVNERTTRVIDATTAVIGGLHQELQANTEAIDALSANIAARRVYIDERLALAEGRITTLADLIPGGAEALGEQPLRQVVEAHARETRRTIWWIIAGLIAVELAQWVVMILILR